MRSSKNSSLGAMELPALPMTVPMAVTIHIGEADDDGEESCDSEWTIYGNDSTT